MRNALTTKVLENVQLYIYTTTVHCVVAEICDGHELAHGFVTYVFVACRFQAVQGFCIVCCLQGMARALRAGGWCLLVGLPLATGSTYLGSRSARVPRRRPLQRPPSTDSESRGKLCKAFGNP